jgi:hypothetical protein
VAPRTAEPLHGLAQVRVAGQRPEGVEDVVQASVAQPVQQGAGVLEHDPRLAALGEQLGDELAHALVAPVEHRGVVVVAQVGVLQHPLQVADDGGGARVRSAGRDERLVHVQGDRERAVDGGDVHRGATEEHRPRPPGDDRLLDPLLRTAQVRQAVEVLWQLPHDPLLAAGRPSPPSLPDRGCGSSSRHCYSRCQGHAGRAQAGWVPVPEGRTYRVGSKGTRAGLIA